MKPLDDELIVTIEGIMQRIEEKRDTFPELAGTARRDSSGWEDDFHFSNTLKISSILEKEALEYIQEFVEIGIHKAKERMRKEQPRPKKKTVSIKDVINGNTKRSV